MRKFVEHGTASTCISHGGPTLTEFCMADACAHGASDVTDRVTEFAIHVTVAQLFSTLKFKINLILPLLIILLEHMFKKNIFYKFKMTFENSSVLFISYTQNCKIY